MENPAFTREGRVNLTEIMQQLWFSEDAADALVANSPEFKNKPAGRTDQWRRED